MVQRKTAALPGSTDKPSKKQKTQASAKDEASAKDVLTLQAAQQVQKAGKKDHLRAPKARETYAQHVNQARRWLQSHFKEDGTLSTPSHAEEGSEIYHDPKFKHAFEERPNHCSSEALAIYLGWRGFNEDSKCSPSTIDGIRAAFKRLWDEASVL